MKYIISLITLLMLLPQFLMADLSVKATDHYDSGGKLMGVIACVAVILIGVALFLFYLERRVKRLEDDANHPL